MSRRGRLAVIAAALVAMLAATALASAGAAGAAKPKTRWVPAPWRQIAKGKTPKLLVIDVPESTRNRRSPCYNHFKARAVKQTQQVIKIRLLMRVRRLPQRYACPAVAIPGPFLILVHLKAPYRDQKLIDATTGLSHKLTPRSGLF